MCSTMGARLARICRAIEELASRSGQGAGERAGTSEPAVAALATGLDGAARPDGASGSDETTAADGENAAEEGAADGKGAASGENAAEGRGAADSQDAADGDVAGRLAEIWAMVADVDPELAKRLPGYLGTAE